MDGAGGEDFVRAEVVERREESEGGERAGDVCFYRYFVDGELCLLV